ncbi:MAG: hypothetical protein WBD63_08285 [Phycisphaerae bacterium]
MRPMKWVALLCVLALAATAGCAKDRSLTREKETIRETISSEPVITGEPREAQPGGGCPGTDREKVETEQTTETRVIESKPVP